MALDASSDAMHLRTSESLCSWLDLSFLLDLGRGGLATEGGLLEAKDEQRSEARVRPGVECPPSTLRLLDLATNAKPLAASIQLSDSKDISPLAHPLLSPPLAWSLHSPIQPVALSNQSDSNRQKRPA